MVTPAMDSVVVVCAANGAYALPLAVMLRSVLEHLHAAHRLRAFVIDDGIAPADKERVVASLTPQATVCWVAPQRSDFGGLPVWGRMPITTYDKLRVAELLPPDIDKAIWLDCDLLLLHDLAQLWHTDLAGRHLLAVQDGLVSHVGARFGIAAHEALGIRGDAPYFNAGTALIDCALWRRDRVGDAALAYLRQHRQDVVFWDQEALNAVLAGRWGALDPRWNCNLGFERPGLDREGHHLGARPWVLHFSGNLKPWRYDGRGAYHALYFRAIDRTAWRGWRPPSSAAGSALAWYESSSLRRRLLPAEQWGLRLLRRATLRFTPEPSA